MPTILRGSDNADSGKLGKVVQTLQGTLDTVVTTTSSTFIDTGITISITPTNSNNKILVSYNILLSNTVTGSISMGQLVRDATPIGNGVQVDVSRTPCSAFCYIAGDNNTAQNASLEYLDSPNTTTLVTYKVQILTYAGGTAVLNRSGQSGDVTYSPLSMSTITVKEIGA